MTSMGNLKHTIDSRVVHLKKSAQNGTRSGGIFEKYPGRLMVKWWGLSAKLSSTPSPLQSKVRYLQACKMIRLVWLLGIAGLIVAGIVFDFFSREHCKHFEDMLMNMCDERARMLQHQFAVSMNHVHSLAILVSTFHVGKQPSALDQGTFAEYTARTAFERPLMTGVAYAQKILHSERQLFEREQGWEIKTMHSKDLSPFKEEYAPTIFSQETIGYLVSLDMMSGNEDQENILRARATGKGVLTRPFRLLESNHLGVVLTFAVYKKDVPIHATTEDRIEATAGYLGGAFDFESLVETLLRQLAKNEAIIVNVYDVTNSSNPLVMYGPDPPDKGFSHLRLSSLDFGDPFRKHEMRCRLAREVPYPKLALGFASGVLALVSLICYMVYNAHMHVKKVEEDYRKMEELKVQAEAADIAKSQFLATVSHEIRTPMNGVLGMLKMLMDTELDTTQQDFARTAHASGKALITLINEVLDQAKIESGRIELEAVPFDLRAILDDVLSLFSGKTRNEGIELAVFVSERVPRVLIGDPGRFRQIVTNLVGNSVKFTSNGHIFVCVHLWEDIESVQVAGRESYSKECRDGLSKDPTSTGGVLSPSPNTLSGFAAVDGWSSWETFKCLLRNGASTLENLDKNGSLGLSDVKLFLSVEDTGVGIPLQAQKRIFTPFMQADSSTSRTYGGTGIGLSISRCLVELMNGEMRFESKENVGTTFTCTLVLKKGRDNSLEDRRRVRSDPLPTQFQCMKALVVDGRPVRAEVTKYHLLRLGLQVKIAYECKEALRILLGREHLDMVLVDMDAWGACTGLTFPHLLKDSSLARRNDLGSFASWNPAKIILLATSIDNEQSEQAKAMGYVDTVIMKPLRASMIAACLQQALGILSKGSRGRGGAISKETSGLQNVLCGKRILVVDDNMVNRRVAAGALKKYGACVDCADCGKDAIAMLKQPHQFDACFMDIQMPEMDGFEATRQIRKNEVLAHEQGGECCKISENSENGCKHNNHVPILAMTADVIQATHEECSRCGMDGYVSKPFEEDQLYRAVAHFFDSARK